ncbi:hypothetical protein MGMO_105c00160 [Methyloglobulus morosus KoM1]|uniref:Uncharacterized protein n=1 Tax=Methyloglobulus morosus KoM1 TaxID=1116472 RepID=V5BU13_9GAMM|nr:hypothetical protein [Methyloglobulus morosus]ESS71364.1 hypothetical protein MGMO_105c00160 [Methyloglobulus morosus KoM1]
MKIFALIGSILLNIVLMALVTYLSLEGCAEKPNGKLGVLSKDLKVGYFNGRDAVFTLPKGLLVRDASATGADWFEPHRFRIVVTSEDKLLVDYSEQDENKNYQHGEYYSADIKKH